MTRRAIAVCLSTAAFIGAATAGEVHGVADVVDGSTMAIGGALVRLGHIVVPPLGAACLWHSQRLDCGKLARAGLKDITAGATVVCTPIEDERHVCRDGEFDLGFGLVHAGWAVPAAGAPVHYVQKMQDARARRRGLWAAQTPDGTEPFVLTLRR